MSISLDEVRHVARLARLELDENDVYALQGALNSLIGHFSDIQGIDISQITPTTHAADIANVWDEDIVSIDFSQEQTLNNAALTKAGLFLVPTIIED